MRERVQLARLSLAVHSLSLLFERTGSASCWRGYCRMIQGGWSETVKPASQSYGTDPPRVFLRQTILRHPGGTLIRTMTLVTIGLVLILAVIAAPSSAVSRPDPQTNQQRDNDPRPGFQRILRGHSSHLGSTVRDLTATELDDQSVLTGVLIEEMRQNSPASRTDLQEGGIVIELDDERVQNARQFRILVRVTPLGWTVEAIIVRDEIEREVSQTMMPDLG